MEPRVEPVSGEDRAWVEECWRTHWNGTKMVSRGKVYEVAAQRGLKALGSDGGKVGLLTYHEDQEAHELQVVSLNSFVEGRGVGTALLRRVMDEARDRYLRRVWLITTNDHVDAVRFYQRRGFRLVAVHLDAVTDARVLKPSIPIIGNDGQPLRDEWELEWRPAGTDPR